LGDHLRFLGIELVPEGLGPHIKRSSRLPIRCVAAVAVVETRRTVPATVPRSVGTGVGRDQRAKVMRFAWRGKGRCPGRAPSQIGSAGLPECGRQDSTGRILAMRSTNGVRGVDRRIRQAVVPGLARSGPNRATRRVASWRVSLSRHEWCMARLRGLGDYRLALVSAYFSKTRTRIPRASPPSRTPSALDVSRMKQVHWVEARGVAPKHCTAACRGTQVRKGGQRAMRAKKTRGLFAGVENAPHAKQAKQRLTSRK